MPLNHYDQVNLLKDILANHQLDCCGSVAECEQLERLAKALMANENININTDVMPIPEEIYRYSQDGVNTQDLDSHILSNQENLSQWVDGMGSLT